MTGRRQPARAAAAVAAALCLLAWGAPPLAEATGQSVYQPFQMRVRGGAECRAFPSDTPPPDSLLRERPGVVIERFRFTEPVEEFNVGDTVEFDLVYRVSLGSSAERAAGAWRMSILDGQVLVTSSSLPPRPNHPTLQRFQCSGEIEGVNTGSARLSARIRVWGDDSSLGPLDVSSDELALEVGEPFFMTLESLQDEVSHGEEATARLSITTLTEAELRGEVYLNGWRSVSLPGSGSLNGRRTDVVMEASGVHPGCRFTPPHESPGAIPFEGRASLRVVDRNPSGLLWWTYWGPNPSGEVATDCWGFAPQCSEPNRYDPEQCDCVEPPELARLLVEVLEEGGGLFRPGGVDRIGAGDEPGPAPVPPPGPPPGPPPNPDPVPPLPPLGPVCGNGVLEAGEQCDGADLGGASCTSLGFQAGGTLACTAACRFDTSGCVQATPPSLTAQPTSLEVTHVRGQSSCPQNVGSVAVSNSGGGELAVELGELPEWLSAPPGRVSVPGTLPIDFNCRVPAGELDLDATLRLQGVDPASGAEVGGQVGVRVQVKVRNP